MARFIIFQILGVLDKEPQIGEKFHKCLVLREILYQYKMHESPCDPYYAIITLSLNRYLFNKQILEILIRFSQRSVFYSIRRQKIEPIIRTAA